MTFVQVIIIGLIYFWGSSTAWSFGVGYYTLYRPVISGLLVGAILGNPVEGMLAGAVVNIVYLDFVSTGGSLKGDPCLTGIIAAVTVVVYKLNPIEAVALAYPFGLIGIFLWKHRLSINSKFVRRADQSIEKGKLSGIIINNAIYPQLVLLASSVITVIIIVYTLNFFIGMLANYYSILKAFLYLSGVLLIAFSVASKLNQLNSKISIISFIIIYLAFSFIKINTAIFIFIVFIGVNILFILKGRWDSNEE